MNSLPKIKILNDMIVILNRDFKERYYALLGDCVLGGMDLETAIYHCWNIIVVPTLPKDNG